MEAPLQPGTRFPSRKLRSLEGKTRSLAEFWSTGPALLIVGHGDCATTRLLLPFVDRMHSRRGGNASVLVILQEDADSADALVAHLGVGLPVLLDEHPYGLCRELGLETVPTLYLVGTDGVLKHRVRGFDRPAIESIAAGIGVLGPLFTVEDVVPALRPG